MNHSNQLIISPQEIEKKINRRIMRRFQRNRINRRMKGGQWLLAKKMKNLLKKFNKIRKLLTKFPKIKNKTTLSRMKL